MSKQVSIKTAKDIDAANAAYVTVTDETEETTSYTVHTNRNGEGLWIDGQQVEGSGQFSAGRNPNATYRRYFSK